MSTVELDFFAMENQSTANSNSTLFRRQRSFKDIQSAISKIKPEILKSLIASAPSPPPPPPPPRSPDADQINLSTSLSPSRMSPEIASDKYPLTIFYNQTVAVFNVSPHQAKSILTFAEKGSSIGDGKDEAEKVKSTAEIPPNQPQELVDVDPQDEDLPLARKRSLQRFLEKRLERSIPTRPYAAGRF